MRPIIVIAVASLVAVVGCVVYNDRCAGFRCEAGEVCIDLEAGPRCVCDDYHELDDAGGCVSIDDGAGSSE